MAGIKQLSAKIGFVAFAIVILLLGTSIIPGETAPISRILVMLFAAVALLTETVVKKIFPISVEKVSDWSVTDIAAVVLSVTVIIVALAGTLWSLPSFLTNLSGFAVIVTAIFIGVQAFM